MSGSAIFLKFREIKTDPGIMWKYVTNMNRSLIPSPTSFRSFPTSTAGFLGSIYHLSGEIKWLQNVTSFSLLTPICSLLILFTVFFSGKTCICCWASLSAFVLGHSWAWTSPVSQGARNSHCRKHVVQHLHHVPSFALLKSFFYNHLSSVN